MSKELKFILWICDEIPKNSYQILADLEREGIIISYPVLMHRIGLLVAQGKLRKMKRLDKKIVYQSVYDETKEEVKK